ncbi:TPA: hypothetical protein EYO77_05290, partial [Candidatus Poribacteria bacterium]|nr:hypothetical protein [Candidatus Poribacteria bacterium]
MRRLKAHFGRKPHSGDEMDGLAICQHLEDGSMQDNEWIHLSEDDHAIKIETDKLEAVIPKKNPKHWMT